MKDGKTIDKVMVPPSKPPATFKAEAAAIPEADVAAGSNVLSNVPAMTWVFGCSATSAAMMFGYYDNTGYPNMYTGPTNGGVFPMTNAAWGTAVINGESGALCPLSATRLGLDGRATKGHVDDYWISYRSSSPDPYIGKWTEHAHGDCTADYMGTNQYKYGSTDGSTWFWYYPDGSPLYNYDAGPSSRDGTYGMRLFAESRGYQVVANFSQYIYGYDGNTKGFTFTDFKNEINAGRPVLIQVMGHTMLGFGYNDTGQVIYIRNTWDYQSYTMTWGGSYYGMQHYAVIVFRLAATAATTPSLTTTAVTSITTSSASSGGNVTSDGGASVTARGVCWSTSANPTISNSHTTNGSGTGSFSSSITGLTPGTVYHVRAYATNSAGTAYGSDLQFTTTSASLPTVSTTTVTSITSTSAASGGSVTSDGGASVTARGVCWSTSANPTISNSHTSDGTGTGSYTSSITGLSPGTVYHVRAYATNGVGTAYGSDYAFNTTATAPTVTTTAVSSITYTSAVSGGDVTSDGGSSVTAKGVCWSTSANPTTSASCTADGAGTGAFTSSITGLTLGTTYHVRAYATNSKGTAYGSDLTFSTPVPTADVWVRVSANPRRAAVGDNVVFTVTVTNNGPESASGVQVTDLLPDGLAHLVNDSGGAYNPGTGLWNVGSLSSGHSATLNITATIERDGRFTNSATRTASSPSDNNGVNDTGQATVSTRAIFMPWIPILLD